MTIGPKELEELERLAKEAADSSKYGGQWCFTRDGYRGNQAMVLSGRKLKGRNLDPMTGGVRFDPDNYEFNIIARCGGRSIGNVRAAFIAAACPATVLHLLEIIESLRLSRDYLETEREATDRAAERYRWLRSRHLETIYEGGVFAGQTPQNLVLNGEDLDAVIDAALASEKASA